MGFESPAVKYCSRWWEKAGLVSQVTYPDPVDFITRENGCDERGATTYKFNTAY